MKFLLDMGVSPQSAKFLRSLGHDAIHIIELQLSRAADSEIIKVARAETRIILTHDLDFGTLMAASGERLPSIIIFRLTDMRPSNVNQYLSALIEQQTDALLKGAILSVNERHVRIRRLPIYPPSP